HNQAVERVIHFDAKTGALQTIALRDVRHSRSYPLSPDSEGVLSFAPALVAVPVLLEGWKYTATAPSDDWTRPGFNDSAWKPVTLPFKTEEENRTWWFRCALPASLKDSRGAFVLLLDHALFGDAEIYLDGNLAQHISAAEHPSDRSIQ